MQTAMETDFLTAGKLQTVWTHLTVATAKQTQTATD
jgi:hypothetical protein